MADPRHQPDSYPFTTFFHRWINQLELYQWQLEAAETLAGNGLDELISAVLRHYQALYEEHSRAAEIDPYQFFDLPWLSSPEKTFLWIGGWKPGVVAFRLIKWVCRLLTAEQAAARGSLSRRRGGGRRS